MNKAEEAAYIEGNRAAWRSILAQAAQQLDMENRSHESWILEREDAIAALRKLCGEQEMGDNNWPDNLHLADIIGKHVYCLGSNAL